MQQFYIEEESKYKTLAPKKKPGNAENPDETVTPPEPENAPGNESGGSHKRHVKATAIAILLAIICVFAALYMYDKKMTNSDTGEGSAQTQEENSEETQENAGADLNIVTGAEVKNMLQDPELSGKYAIVVGTKGLLKDEISYDIKFLKYITNEQVVSFKTSIDGEEYDVKALNFGACFSEEVMTKEGSGFRFYGKLLDEPTTYQGHDKSGEIRTITAMPTNNEWDATLMPISDDEKFLEYEIYDGEGTLAGWLYTPY